MESETNGANQTVVTEFVLLGLHDHHNLEMVLFVLCLGIYSVNARLPRHRGDEGLRLLHGLEANLATSLQTPQEA